MGDESVIKLMKISKQMILPAGLELQKEDNQWGSLLLVTCYNNTVRDVDKEKLLTFIQISYIKDLEIMIQFPQINIYDQTRLFREVSL